MEDRDAALDMCAGRGFFRACRRFLGANAASLMARDDRRFAARKRKTARKRRRGRSDGRLFGMGLLVSADGGVDVGADLLLGVLVGSRPCFWPSVSI